MEWLMCPYVYYVVQKITLSVLKEGASTYPRLLIQV
jgi:hypothetical protein